MAKNRGKVIKRRPEGLLCNSLKETYLHGDTLRPAQNVYFFLWGNYVEFFSYTKAARFTAINIRTRTVNYFPREGGRYIISL